MTHKPGCIAWQFLTAGNPAKENEHGRLKIMFSRKRNRQRKTMKPMTNDDVSKAGFTGLEPV